MIEGFADPRFFAVRRELERNFAERGEVGAAVAVTIEGRTERGQALIDAVYESLGADAAALP